MRVGDFSPQQLLQMVSKASLEGVKPGDVLEGRVVSAENGMLLVRMADGKLLTAKTPEQMEINLGTFLTLKIGEMASDQVQAKIMAMDGKLVQDAMLQASGASTGLQAQDVLVKNTLQALGVNATPELVNKVMDLVQGSAEPMLDKAVFLAENNMAQDAEMTAFVGRLAEGTFHISTTLQTISNQLSTALSGLSTEQLKQMAAPVLASSAAGNIASQLADGLANLLKDVGVQLDQTQMARASLALEQTISKGMQEGLDTNQLMTKLAETIGKDPAIKPILQQLTIQTGDKISGQITNDLAVDHLMQRLGTLLSETSGKPATQTDATLSKWLNDQVSLLKGELQGLDARSQVDLKQMVEKFVGKPLLQVGSDADQLLKDLHLPKLVHDIRERLELVREALPQMNDAAAASMRPLVYEADTALRFFNQVNSYNTFVQIPIEMNQQEARGELYVMQRKGKRGKIDPENFTIFLALDTENLGKVESLANAHNRHVTLNFRVANEEVRDIVKELHKTLYLGLKEKNYQLVDMKVRLLDDEPMTILTANKRAAEILGLNASFDIRL